MSAHAQVRTFKVVDDGPESNGGPSAFADALPLLSYASPTEHETAKFTAAFYSNSAIHPRNTNIAPTAISAKPMPWFTVIFCPRYNTENPAKTASVMTSCMPFSCAAE